LAEWDRGIAAGLLSGIMCGALLSIIWFFIIIPDIIVWGSSGASYRFFGFLIAQGGTIDYGGLVFFVTGIGPGYGIIVGLWLAYNQSETKEPLSLRDGFRYGTTFALPLATITALLIFVLSPAVLIIHLISIAGIGVLLFGYVLTLLWNHNWSL
jgi:hypothetical protein